MITQFHRLRNSCFQECFIPAWHRYRLTDQILARTVLWDLSGTLLSQRGCSGETHGQAEGWWPCHECLLQVPPQWAVLFSQATSQQHPLALPLWYGLKLPSKLGVEAWAPKYWLWVMKFAYTLQEGEEHLICNTSVSKLYSELNSASESTQIHPVTPTRFHKIKQLRGRKTCITSDFCFTLFVSGKR